jgi:hypothetical protein
VTDLANRGIDAVTALRNVLAGTPISESAVSASDVVRTRILNAFGHPRMIFDLRNEEDATDESYSFTADVVAGILLTYSNEGNSLNIDQSELWELIDMWSASQVEGGLLNDILHSCTAFQWGWSVNCVRWLSGLDPIPNPAFVTIALQDEVGKWTPEEL